MPIIPKLQETNRLQIGSPVPIASTSEERSTGNSFAALGEGITKAADAGAQFLSAQKRAKEITTLETVKAQSEAIGDSVYGNTLKTGAPDGSNLQEKFDPDYKDK